MNMTVFWDVVPCSLVDTDDVSEVPTVSIIGAIALMVEALSTRKEFKTTLQ
jgi:hypothetical protein